MSEKELTSRSIPGITWKQVIAYTGFITIGVFGYANMMNKVDNGKEQSKQNYNLLIELQTERKQDRKLDDARIHLMELQISECKTRLDIMEKFIEGYNKVK